MCGDRLRGGSCRERDGGDEVLRVGSRGDERERERRRAAHNGLILTFL